jgi:hypothetical protein
MDYWAQNCLAEIDEAAAAGIPPPGHCSDAAMADTVMDFLFASQDASTASLVWTLCLMADHPDVLAKVRRTSIQGLHTVATWYTTKACAARREVWGSTQDLCTKHAIILCQSETWQEAGLMHE